MTDMSHIKYVEWCPRWGWAYKYWYEKVEVDDPAHPQGYRYEKKRERLPKYDAPREGLGSDRDGYIKLRPEEAV